MIRIYGRRVGVLAYSPRSREYIRRVMRALGYSPFVFTNIDEFMALGSGSLTFDLLVLGDAPDVDSQGRNVVEWVLDAIGPSVPMLHAPMHQQVRPIRRRASGAGAVAAPRFFSDLYRVVLAFLDSLGYPSTPRLLVWDRYAFYPTERIVSFSDEELKLDSVDFDIALELFYGAGRPVSKRWLTRMLPSGEHGANWHRIDNLACTIDELCVALQLDGSHGWTLETLSDDSYKLLSSLRPPAPESTPRPPEQARERVRRDALPVSEFD